MDLTEDRPTAEAASAPAEAGGNAALARPATALSGAAISGAAISGAEDRLARLWRRGSDFLGCEHAIMGGAMSWISERHLVAAISNAGGFGVVACGSLNPEGLDREIAATQGMTARPFGVNLITMHPQLLDLIAVCLRRGVSHIVLAGGVPPRAAMEKVKQGGAKLVCFSPTAPLAKKLIRGGADAIVIEGTEAGGHIGPVATSVLAQEILPQVPDVPIFVAGGIGRGEAILAFLEMGAAGVQLGTRFVCAHECIAHPNFKRAFIHAKARDAMPSVQVDPSFPVIPVRALGNAGTRRFVEFQHEVIARFRAGAIDQLAAQLEIEHFWAGALRRAVIEGDVANGSLMAGQSVGMVEREQSTAEIVRNLVAQATGAIAARELAARSRGGIPA